MVAMEMLQKFTVPGLTWAMESARTGKGVQWLSSLTGLLCSSVVESESKCCPEDWELHALWNIWEGSGFLEAVGHHFPAAEVAAVCDSDAEVADLRVLMISLLPLALCPLWLIFT